GWKPVPLGGRKDPAMAKKFIPDSDVEFANKARNFAAQVSEDPARYHLPEADAQAIAQAVAAFARAHSANAPRQTRSSATAIRKNTARAEAERLIRKAGNLIRVNEQISAGDKVNVGVREKPTKLRKRDCPQTRPVLRLVAGKRGWEVHNNRHLIRFADSTRAHSEAKPDGAARLELFVGVIPAGEMAPDAPSPRFGGHPMYLRSYSRSPIDVDYPKFAGPVQVVYWGRWASATGETGPFSRTLAVPVDAFAQQPALPDRTNRGLAEQQTVFVTTVRRELPHCVEAVEATAVESSRLLPVTLDKTAEAEAA
ncbi:MAG: hypothetical protein M3478_16140, partial [Planctomycetota bacterium]|nr:hypothetical protein [Planctomycetota bacterium]